jgi:UDP-2-acetamido-3-amino-2,3-dideoxy-glucuronate N-acetyltransferase
LADNYFKHPSAIVDDGAVIGDETKIWHFTHIAAGAKIGKNCTIGQGVYVAPTAVIGDGVKVQNNVSVFDGVKLESHVFVGPSVVFTNVNNPRSEIVRKDAYQPTTVRVGATIGANVTIICGCEIGSYAFVGAGAVVTAHVPAYALIWGVPARQYGWMCRCGVQLNVEQGSGAAYCAACGRGYRAEDNTVTEV